MNAIELGILDIISLTIIFPQETFNPLPFLQDNVILDSE